MITKDKDIKSIVQKAITDYPYDDYWEQEGCNELFNEILWSIQAAGYDVILKKKDEEIV